MSLRILSNELHDKARGELNEVPSEVEESIQFIRKWLLKQAHLKARTDDQWILTFLRGSKFNLQRTKSKLEMFYTTRCYMPELYTNRDPLLPEIQEILKLGLCLPFPSTDGPDGLRVILIRCCTYDPTKIKFINVLKVTTMIIDILLNEDDNFIIGGQKGLADFKGFNRYHVFCLNISLLKRLSICLQQAYPTRPKGFHCINTPTMFDKFYNMLAPLFPEKLKQRMTIQSSKSTKKLQDIISPAILPKDYGGFGPTVEELINFWTKKVESYRGWFLEEEQMYGLDKSKLTGKAKK